MKHQYNLFFPTQIHSFSSFIDAQNLAHLIQAIRALRQEDSTGLERSNFAELGGWHSHNSLHQDPRFSQVVAAILVAGRAITDHNQYQPEHPLVPTDLWAIINGPGSSNRAHVHPNSLWSGVFYLQTPEDCGNIEFIDPRTPNVMQSPHWRDEQQPKEAWTKVDYKPEAGKMLIFPAWLYHAVMPNLTTASGDAADRIILSFNLSQKP